MSKNLRSTINPLAVVLTISCVLPACEGFVCSQERIKAIEYANKGADEFKNNLYDSAEKDLKQAMATDPTYEIAYYNLGKVYQKQRKWDKAAEQFEAAVSRAPNNANYQYDLGEAYLEAKKIDQAEKVMRIFMSPGAQAVESFFAVLILGAIVTLIVAAFLRRDGTHDTLPA